MPRVTLDGVRVRAARGEAPAIGRWAAVAHAFVAIALALPVAVAAVILAWAFVEPGQTVANRWLLALLGAAFAVVVGWAAMLPQVRSLEVSAARTLLGAALPDVTDPRSWGSRRRGALWLLTLVVTGLALTVALLYLVPLGVGLLAHPLTGQPELRWPGGGARVRVGTGWPLRSARYLEVRRCWPSSTRVFGAGAGCRLTPANSRGLNGTPPASRNMTAPIG